MGCPPDFGLVITGGILTAVGLTFAGVTVSLKRGKIIKDYKFEIEKGRSKLESHISGKLQEYIADIKQRIDGTFGGFDAMLELEEGQLADLETRQSGLEKEFEGLK